MGLLPPPKIFETERCLPICESHIHPDQPAFLKSLCAKLNPVLEDVAVELYYCDPVKDEDDPQGVIGRFGLRFYQTPRGVKEVQKVVKELQKVVKELGVVLKKGSE